MKERKNHPKSYHLTQAPCSFGSFSQGEASCHEYTFMPCWWWWFSCYVLSDSWDPTDCSLPGSSVQGISKTKILELEWVAISFTFSVPFYALVKLCYTKALEWSSLVPGPRAKSFSLEIMNLTPFTINYQHVKMRMCQEIILVIQRQCLHALPFLPSHPLYHDFLLNSRVRAKTFRWTKPGCVHWTAGPVEEQVRWKVMMKLAKKILVTVLFRFNQCFPFVGVGHIMRHVGYSPTRDWTYTSCAESLEFSPLDQQGSPRASFLRTLFSHFKTNLRS